MNVDLDRKKPKTTQQELSVDSIGTNSKIDAIGDTVKQGRARELQKALIKMKAGQERICLQNDQDVEMALSELMRKKIIEQRYSGYKTEKKIQDFEVITGGKDISKLSISEILFLKRRNVDLARLLLVKESNHTEEFSSASIKENDSFVANFGDNEDFDAALGAGDILPYSVTEVVINGQKGFRKTSPRPGFYTERGKYLPIYDGYKIKIAKIAEVKKEDVNQCSAAEKKHFDDMRMEDIIENDCKPTELAEDKELIARAKEEMERRREARKKYDAYCSKEGEHKKEEFMATFGEIVRTEASKYGIPEDLLLELFYKESKFNPGIRNAAGSSAFGLGQILSGTWVQITRDILQNSNMDRKNPEHQIVATCAYLNWIRNLRSCSWGDAVVYYHAGPNFGEKNIAKAWRLNKGALLPHLPDGLSEPRDVRDYLAAARGYYGVDRFSDTGGISTASTIAEFKERLPHGNTLYIGDSIAVGLGDNKAWECARVGKTTGYILDQVRKVSQESLQGKMIVIHCGTNDMVNNGISVNTSIDNIKEIIRICQEKGASDVKVCTLSEFSGTNSQYNPRVSQFNAGITRLQGIKVVQSATIARDSGDHVHYTAQNLQYIRTAAQNA